MKNYISVLTLCFALVACGGGSKSQTSAQPVSSLASSVMNSVSQSTISSMSLSSSSENNSSVSSSNTSQSSSSTIAISCTDLTAQTLETSDVEIDSNTAFSAYGVLDLQLSSEVNVDSMVVCLKDQRDTAKEADSLESTTITDKGNNLYQVQLSRYQLPVEYELVVYHGNPVVQTTLTLQPDTRSRIAFISKTKGTGDLASWTADTSDTSLQAADSVCTEDAHAAGLVGEYKAFLSINGQVDAVCRLQNVDGLASSNCSPATTTPEQATAPFLNLKGLPIAYGVDDIKQGFWRLPVGYFADGKQGKLTPTIITAWTGSITAGTSSSAHHCNNWTSSANTVFGDATASPGINVPSDEFSYSCNEAHALLCFSASTTPHPLSFEHKRSGKLAYVKETKSNLVLAEADEACMQSKPDNISSVVAWFGDQNADAICRLIGRSGQVDTNCGGSNIDWSIGPWVRADGYVVAESLNDLTEAVLAPVLLGADGTFAEPQAPEVVRTDTFPTGSASTNSCLTGDRMSSDRPWTYNSNAACSNIVSFRTFVYCFER